MAKLKAWLTGLVIGLLLGLWGGINIGKEQPLYANPFTSKSVPDTVRKASKNLLRESGKALEKGGEALKEKAGDSK
jgi:hypothetical protein